ncbi:MAG TPA: Uma2 family endonuclease [Chroococcidiopsis sp.]
MATPIPLLIPKTLRLTDAQFLEFVRANPDLRLERTATGELIAMSPTGSETGNYNSELTADITLWNRQQRLGKVFDSSSGFRLPNGAIRSPDVAWVAQSRWNALTLEQQQGFAPLCPDFVIELMSKSDDQTTLQLKMQEYLDNGCQLGWLIVPTARTVGIYRPQHPPEMVDFETPLYGEPVLPGFILNLQAIFAT